MRICAGVASGEGASSTISANGLRSFSEALFVMHCAVAQKKHIHIAVIAHAYMKTQNNYIIIFTKHRSSMTESDYLSMLINNINKQLVRKPIGLLLYKRCVLSIGRGFSTPAGPKMHLFIYAISVFLMKYTL